VKTLIVYRGSYCAVAEADVKYEWTESVQREQDRLWLGDRDFLPQTLPISHILGTKMSDRKQ